MRDLRADLEICNKATPGPWYREKTGAEFNGFSLECLIGTTSLYTTGNNIFAQPQRGSFPAADANFIAAAREGWPEAIERAIKAEAEVVRLRAGLERFKTTIKEYHPHDTLSLPKFSFAKELHDIALAELEVTP